MNDAEIRHDRFACELRRVQVFDDSAHDAGFVRLERRHIDAADGRKLAEQLRLAPSRALCIPHRERNLRRHVLAVSDQHRVHKRGNRRGVAGAGAAADDQRVVLAAVFCQQRDAGKIQHLQDVGVAHLIEKRKANDVKLLQRATGFQREERHMLLAKHLLHIRPGRKRALAGDAVHAVERVVENPRAKVRHADFVYVGKQQRKAEIRLLFHDAVPLSADIARGFFHAGKQAVKCCLIQSSVPFHPHHFMQKRRPNRQNSPNMIVYHTW